MTHNNRGRLAVALGGNWRLYTNTIPAGSQAIGTVTRDGYDTGALVLIEATGLYVQVNAGSVRSLPQAKVAAALSPAAGRPAELEGGKRVNVYLDEATRSRALEIGSGSLSAGLRAAVAHYRK